ncbi:hypothetical protein [Symbiopectobacterium sp. RP]
MLHDLNLSIGGIDARLNRRYQRLVKQHMTPAAPLASAVIAKRLNFDYII